MNRLRNASQPPILFVGLIVILLVRVSGKTFRRRVFNALGGTRDACLLGELFCSTPPRRPAVRADPTRPLYVRVLDSTSLHKSSVDRFYRKTLTSVKPRRLFFDCLGGGRVGCLLAGPTRRRPVLLVPAPPRRPAVRRPVQTCAFYSRILDSRSRIQNPSIPWAKPGWAAQGWAEWRNGAGTVGVRCAQEPIYHFAFQSTHFFRSLKPRNTTGRSGRDGARRGGGAGPVGAGRDAGGFVRPEDNLPSCLPGNRRQLSWTTFRKLEQSRFYVNRNKNKIRVGQPVYPR